MKYWQILLLCLSLLATACGGDDDGPNDDNEEEEINSGVLLLSQVNVGTRSLSFVDADGADGPLDVVALGGTLDANATYDAYLGLSSEQSLPASFTADGLAMLDVSVEVADESDEHQVFYLFNGLDATYTYADTDDDGRPLGLVGTITTGDPGTGTLTVVLRHEPTKDAAGVSEGDITNANGETDIMVEFDVTIE